MGSALSLVHCRSEERTVQSPQFHNGGHHLESFLSVEVYQKPLHAHAQPVYIMLMLASKLSATTCLSC